MGTANLIYSQNGTEVWVTWGPSACKGARHKGSLAELSSSSVGSVLSLCSKCRNFLMWGKKIQTWCQKYCE